MTTFETLKAIEVLSSAISRLGVGLNEDTIALYAKLKEAAEGLDFKSGDNELAAFLREQGLPSGKDRKLEAPSDVFLKGKPASSENPEAVKPAND